MARLDDDDDFDLSKGDADSDDENGEGMQGKTTAAEAEVKKPVWSGPRLYPFQTSYSCIHIHHTYSTTQIHHLEHIMQGRELQD